MQDRLLVRYESAHASLRAWRIGDAGAVALGSATDASQWPRDLTTWVVVPAASVGYALTRMGPLRREQLARAIPFALEDQIAEPVERLQFAVVPRNDGAQEAWWVARAQLREWMENLADRDVTPSVLLPETALLAEGGVAAGRFDDGASSLLLHTSVRTSIPYAVLADLEPDAADESLALRAREPGSLEAALCEAAQRAPNRPASNLLVETFAPRHATSSIRAVWRTAALLGLLAAVLATGWLFADRARLEQRREALFEQQQAIYREAVPGARQVPDPVGQLRALRGADREGSQFLETATAVASLIGANPQLKLQQIDWRNEALEVTVIAADVAALDAFRQQCDQLPGTTAELGAVARVPGGTEGRIELRKKPA